MAKARVKRPQAPRSAPAVKPDAFQLWCKAHGLPVPAREVAFATPDRKYRADYYFPAHGVIVEVNGGIWRTGAHSSGRGLLRDYSKMNLAQVLGYRYLTYTPAQLAGPQCLADLTALLL